MGRGDAVKNYNNKTNPMPWEGLLCGKCHAMKNYNNKTNPMLWEGLQCRKGPCCGKSHPIGRGHVVKRPQQNKPHAFGVATVCMGRAMLWEVSHSGKGAMF